MNVWDNFEKLTYFLHDTVPRNLHLTMGLSVQYLPYNMYM